MVERYKVTSSWVFSCSFLNTLRKCSHCWAFLTSTVVLTRRDLQRCGCRGTRSTHSPLMYRGAGAALLCLKTRMSSLVFVMFSAKLFDAHHSPSFRTSSLSAALFQQIWQWCSLGGRDCSWMCRASRVVGSAHSPGESQCWECGRRRGEDPVSPAGVSWPKSNLSRSRWLVGAPGWLTWESECPPLLC